MSNTTVLDKVMQRAEHAFQQYRNVNAADRSIFIRAIADQLDALGDILIQTAQEETNLPETRLKNERARTTNQLISFARLLETGNWVQASIDTGEAQRKPVPKPDIRKMVFPIGPVVVFGASNFPLAFSTAGGDTASALAAGCSVVVKSHPAHSRTSSLVAGAIERAITKCNIPLYTFQHIEDTSSEAGQYLVQHPAAKAAAFTGSYQAGKALFNLANKRNEPIPLFAEMGSINPVVLLPQVIRENKELPALLASSITLGVGQFCTNPGLLLVMEDMSESVNSFLKVLADYMTKVTPAKMLHQGIAKSYQENKRKSLVQQGVSTLADVDTVDPTTGAAALASISAADFLKSEILREEVFGPYSLVVRCTDKVELIQVINSLHGQLTATVFGSKGEETKYADVISSLHQRCGRLIFNNVPTGVEVCKSMQHGGPFPSTTDSRFTSVGVDAIYRFARPVCFQDFPMDLLPDELKDINTLNIIRCVNDVWTREDILN